MEYTYTIRIRVAYVEKFFGVGRVCVRFEDVFDAVCTADAQGKSHAAYENIHIIFRCEETATGERQYGIGDASVGIHPHLGSMTGLSYMLDDVMVMVPELSGFTTIGLCTANA